MKLIIILDYGHDEFCKDRIGSDDNIKQYSSVENRKQDEKLLHSGCTSLCVFKGATTQAIKLLRTTTTITTDDNFENAYGCSRDEEMVDIKEEHENNRPEEEKEEEKEK
ncbi:hypothetical protein ACTFIU_003290 [Dictyostelium citrinum]